MYFPLFLLVPCKTWCFQVNYLRIFVFFVHTIHRREEYRLSFAQIFPPGINPKFVMERLHIRRDNVLEEIVRK